MTHPRDRVLMTNAASAAPVASTHAVLTVLTITPPLAVTMPATNVTARSAMLAASVNPRGALTHAWFEYGLTTDYGLSTPAVAVSGSAESPMAVSIVELLPGTNYHYRVVATNRGGTALGADLVFTTTAEVPRPTISQWTVLTNGWFKLWFTGVAGGAYTVLASTNLVDWEAIGTTNESGDGAFEFTDTAAPDLPHCFYQLRGQNE